MNEDDMLRAWLAEVDAAAIKIAGVSIDDLDDQPFDEWYERGMRPVAAAKRTLRGSGWRG